MKGRGLVGRLLPPGAVLPALVAALLMGPPGAAAQDEDGDGNEDIARARQLMEQGQGHYVAGRYREAAQAFLEAYEAKAMPAFLYNAAMAYEKRGEPGKAADQFARYLAEEPEASDADEVRERIERLRTEQAAREQETGIEVETRTERRTVRREGGGEAQAEPAPDPAPERKERKERQTRPENMKSMLSIQTTPRGAAIRVYGADGVVAEGQSPFFHSLGAGQYDVVIEKEGYRPVERPVTVQAGRVYSIIVEMSQGEFTGLLRVTSSPPGAAVYLDDRSQGPLGRTPWQSQVAAGEHRVWLERPGYEPVEQTVTVEASKEAPMRVELERVAVGRLRVVANVDGARVSIDGKPAGEVPLEVELPAGPHRVLVEADGMKSWGRSVVVAKGQLTPVRVQLHEAVPRGGAWATAVLSALALGAGTTLAVMSENRYDDLRAEADQGRLASNDERLFRAKLMSIGADTAFGVGGLLALISLYYFVRDPLPDSEGTVLEPRDWAVNPQVGPEGAGATLQWSF